MVSICSQFLTTEAQAANGTQASLSYKHLCSSNLKAWCFWFLLSTLFFLFLSGQCMEWEDSTLPEQLNCLYYLEYQQYTWVKCTHRNIIFSLLPECSAALRSLLRRMGPTTVLVFHVYGEMALLCLEMQPLAQRVLVLLLSQITMSHCR